MKKSVKILSSLLALALVGFTAVSCSKGEVTPTTTPAPTTTTTTATTVQSSLLTFIGDNQFRVDVMDDDLGVTFKYNNAAITNKQAMSYVSGGGLTFEGDAAYDDLSFILVTETGNSSSVFYAPGIIKAELTNYLNSSVNDDLVNGTKVYLAVFHGTPAKWTKNLNAEMDARITSAINAV